MTPEEDAHGSRATGPQGHLPALHFHVFEQLKQRNVFRVALLYLSSPLVSRLKLHDRLQQPGEARVHLIPADTIQILHPLLGRPDQSGLAQNAEVM